MLHWSRPAWSLSGRILQKICHRFQDLSRKHLIGYGARQRHRSDQRAKSQDRSRPRCALVFPWQQPDKQLKVIPDLFSGKRAGTPIAATDLRCQCTEGTARTWILAVHIAQVVVDQLRKGERPPTGFSSFLLALPDAECIAERLGHEFVPRIEVLVEAAHREASFLHQLRNSESCKTLFAESLCGNGHDALVSLLLLGL